MKISFNCTDDQQVVHTHKDAGLSDQVPCSKPDISPEAYLNDYRNRMPFHYIEEGTDGYYYWQYGSIMDLVINFVDEIAQSEDMPEAVLDVRINDKSVVDPVSGIAHLGSMALTQTSEYYTLNQINKIVGTLSQQIKDLQEGGVASIVDTPENLMPGQLLMWDSEARRLVGSPLVKGDAEKSIILKTSSDDPNYAMHEGAILLGKGLISSFPYQFIIGYYNKLTPEEVFSVGTGFSKDTRSTAFSISRSGKVKVFNPPVDKDEVVRKEELDVVSTIANNAVVANKPITAGTHTKLTYDSKGLVTEGSDLAASDIPELDTSKITSGTFSDERIASADIWNAKQDALTEAQLSAVDSGITSTKVVTYDKCAEDIDKKLDKTGGTVQGSLIISENLIVNGTTSTVHTQNLKVADKLIYVAKDNTVPLTSPAGIITPKYDGTNNGGIVYDNTGTAYVGDINLDSSGNVDVNNSDLQPIATRDAIITNGNIVKWDNTNKKLVDSGKSTEDLSTATNLENGTGLDTLVLKYSGQSDETHYPSSTTGESDVCLGEANTSSGKRNILGGKLNVNTGSNNLVVGLRNNISSNHNVVGGQDNTSSQGHHNLIGGRQNTVKSYDNILAGHENIVSENGQSNIVAGEQNPLGRVVNSIICGDNDGLQLEKLMGGIKAGLGLLNNSDIQGKALFGYYNKPKTNTVLEVGNGTSLNKRSNAFEVLKDGSAIIGGVDTENNNATLPDYQVAPDGWLDFTTTVTEGNQNLSVGARNYVRGNYNITSGLFNTIFSTEIQKDENGNEKLDENGNPMPELVTRSLAIGYMNQVRKGDSAAIGDRNVVTGGNSVALAYKNKVYADAAVALGHSNTIGTKGQTGNAAQSSIATGEGNIITGTASFAANAYNEVKGDYAAAFGGNNHANGYASFVAGQENESTNQRNFIYGFKNKSSKSDSVLLGTGLVSDTAEKIVIVGNYNSNDNIVQGETLFAIGGGSSDSTRKNTLVVNRSNIYTNAKFNFKDATGATVAAESLSIGTENNSAGETITAPPLAKTYHSIRVGENNTVDAYKSGVFGVSNSLTGSIENSFIFGGYNTAIKSYSFMTGRGLQDKFRNEWWHPKFTIGRYNLDTEEIKDRIFVVGNGTSDSNRSNAFEITADGRAKVRSAPIDDDDVVRKTELGSYIKNTDYSSPAKAGVIRTVSNTGFRTNSTDGALLTVPASNLGIDNRANNYEAGFGLITPYNLDYAIKSGLSSNKLAWTEEEKASARATIGAVGINDIPEVIDNLTTDDATKALSAAQGKILKDKVDGKSASYVCDNYEQAIAFLNNDTYPFKTGDNLFIVQLDVPDLWISGMAGGDEATYTYTTDEQFIADIRAATAQYGNYSGDPGLVVGKYRVCQLETQKVDLTNYVKNTDYATVTKAGVVKVGDMGIGINNGSLYINPANTYLLQQQISMYTPVVPGNIAMAVKQGLINPNKSTSSPANWTEEEKASARATIGAASIQDVVTKTEYQADMGDIDAALTAILEIQNSLISGEQTYDNIIDNVGAALDNIIAKQQELIGGGS